MNRTLKENIENVRSYIEQIKKNELDETDIELYGITALDSLDNVISELDIIERSIQKIIKEVLMT